MTLYRPMSDPHDPKPYGKPVPDTKAVAIQKKGGNDRPVVTAKGSGFNAEKILEIAFNEDVKVRQDQALTELLQAYDIDCPIPLEALNAVSIILDRVYRENERLIEERESNTESNDP